MDWIREKQVKPYIRKEIVIIDEVRKEMGKSLAVPLCKCAAIAIIENPYAGRYIEDLSLYGEYGAFMGRFLINMALDSLKIKPLETHSYGKAAVVGLDGELEQGSALIHINFDAPIREILQDTKSIIPSSEKVAPAGCSIDIPLHHKKALKVRSHYDTMEVRVGNSPHPNEIMLILCIATGSRPFPRVGGLQIEDIKGFDGIS
jgi:hypothetical protein